MIYSTNSLCMWLSRAELINQCEQCLNRWSMISNKNIQQQNRKQHPLQCEQYPWFPKNVENKNEPQVLPTMQISLLTSEGVNI